MRELAHITFACVFTPDNLIFDSGICELGIFLKNLTQESILVLVSKKIIMHDNTNPMV